VRARRWRCSAAPSPHECEPDADLSRAPCEPDADLSRAPCESDADLTLRPTPPPKSGGSAPGPRAAGNPRAPRLRSSAALRSKRSRRRSSACLSPLPGVRIVFIACVAGLIRRVFLSQSNTFSSNQTSLSLSIKHVFLNQTRLPCAGPRRSRPRRCKRRSTSCRTPRSARPTPIAHIENPVPFTSIETPTTSTNAPKNVRAALTQGICLSSLQAFPLLVPLR
jgi:hypothetical protein